MIRVAFLGSGSGGNATALSFGRTLLLLDCGFSARETARRMAVCGLDASAVTAMLVTHEHADHLCGVPVFARRHDVPVFLSDGTRRASRLADERGCETHCVRAGETFSLGEVCVTPFRTSHDCAEPLGYRFDAPDGTSVGIATDTGVASDELAEALDGCRLLGIEANHDVDMLENGPYPLFLRRRIASDRGHLSNAAAAALLERLVHDGLRQLVGMHVSRQNNTAELAARTLRVRLAVLGLDVPVAVADQDVPLVLAT